MLMQSPASISHSLWPLLTPPNDSYIRYFAKKDGRTVGGWIRNEHHFASLITSFRDSKWDAYIQPNPSLSKLGKRGSTADTHELRWLLVDIDPIVSDSLDFEYSLCMDGRTWIPTVAIKSGRGIQLWYRLDHALLTKDIHEKELARHIVAHFLRHASFIDPINHEFWKIDFLPDLPRLMRMPGTYNSKNGKMALLLEVNEDYRMLTHDLMEWAGPSPEHYELPKMEGQVWQQVISHLPRDVRRYIMEGVEAGDRHRLAFATAAALRDVGTPFENALVAVYRGSDRCRPARDEDRSFTTAEITRAVKGAYGIT